MGVVEYGSAMSLSSTAAMFGPWSGSGLAGFVFISSETLPVDSDFKGEPAIAKMFFVFWATEEKDIPNHDA